MDHDISLNHGDVPSSIIVIFPRTPVFSTHLSGTEYWMPLVYQTQLSNSKQVYRVASVP
jgi:hypothetical protein